MQWNRQHIPKNHINIGTIRSILAPLTPVQYLEHLQQQKFQTTPNTIKPAQMHPTKISKPIKYK